MTQVSIATGGSVQLSHIPSEVRYKHLRLIYMDYLTLNEEVYNKGGVTIAYRYLSSEEMIDLIGTDVIPAIIVGFAGCSIEDNFSRHLGRRIALERLATSQVVIAGQDYIQRLMTASEPYEVADVITGPMKAQGVRFELCT